MIRANVKSARPPAVIVALQKRERHKIISVAKLESANADVGGGQGHEEKQKPNPMFAVGEDASHEEVNQEAPEDRINVGPRDIIRRGKRGAGEDVPKKNNGGQKAELIRPRFRPCDRKQSNNRHRS